jgi:hypothetical protein
MEFTEQELIEALRYAGTRAIEERYFFTGIFCHDWGCW